MPKKVGTVLSHWYHLVENFQHSPQEFYSVLEKAIKRRQLPDISLSRVDYLEAGILSAKREYLRVQQKEHLFDICAAPYGNGFFVSWWLAEVPSSSGLLLTIGAVFLSLYSLGFFMNRFGFFEGIMAALAAVSLAFVVLAFLTHEGLLAFERSLMEAPVLGAIYERLFQPKTYYKIDTALMFQESVRSAVLETLDHAREAKGLRSLTESERKPILTDLFKR